jgi:hypothetical protein
LELLHCIEIIDIKITAIFLYSGGIAITILLAKVESFLRKSNDYLAKLLTTSN